MPVQSTSPPLQASEVPTQSGSAADSNANAAAAASAAPLGAPELNARVAAGAAVYTSHPNIAVPPHLLEAEDAHDQTAPAGTMTPAAEGQKPAAPAAVQPQSPDSAAQPQPAATATAASPPAPLPPQQSPSAAAGHLAQTLETRNDQNQSAADDANPPAPAATASLAQTPTTTTAPQTTDAATRSVSPYIPVGEQVAISLKQAASVNTDEIRIQLKPASLGAIDVKLNVAHDGRVTAVISADRSDTLNMLKQDSGNLQQALREAGLNADGGSLSFNLRGEGQSFAQNAPQSSSSANTADAGPDSSSAAGEVPALRLHTGSLDIQV